MATEQRTLDATVDQKVSYCIPIWLRDEQIRVNISAVPGRIAESYELREEPIAIVCYGPSLKETWERIREFKYVMSCSGAHKFLIDRGIVPTWHADVDPREHKIKLIGEPHKNVEYLLASTCHPAYFRMLRDGAFNVKLWHVFDPDDDAIRALPRGEWALTGGCSVGLRTMAIARFFGFRQQHIFGMDGNASQDEMSHASEHPNAPPKWFKTEYGGRTFYTTPALLEAARTTWHELNQLKDVEAIFYGDGLVQAMAKDYVRKTPPGGAGPVGFNRPETITPEFRELNRRLHEDKLEYGVGGGRHADTVKKLVASLAGKVDSPVVSVLDYGCGKGYLGKKLGFPIYEYDPAIPGKDESPRPADVVVCTDVLEHIEPDKLMFVLDDLRRCVKHIGYFTIHTGPAKKTYADGRNTHLIQNGFDWWKRKLEKYFHVGKIIPKGVELHVLVAPKKKDKGK